MICIKILLMGKSKEPWIDSAIASYIQRLSSTLSLQEMWFKEKMQLLSQVKREKKVLCLDPKGETLSSLQFATRLAKWCEEGGSRLALVVGEAQGLPLELKSYPAISLSTLTFTHQMCRLVLAEQIYRSAEIWRGSPYHK